MRRRTVLGLALLAFAVFTPVALAGASSSVTLNLVAYSTPRAAYADNIPAFQATAAGKDVQVTQSYGASGDQARAVAAGQPADIVALSLEPDITTLVKAGLVDPSWNKNTYKGMVTNSVVVFVLRNGNPKHIRTWNDLLKPGVQVITPNPFTSGGARWNVMAAYGAWLKEKNTPAQARAKLLKLFKNVTVQDSSARNALQTFTSGKGDVLLDYENEALFAHLPYVIPKETILIQNPIATLKGSQHQTEAKAFVSFLRTPAAQRIFAKNGYRPVVPSVVEEFRSQFPTRHGLFRIDWLGGWNKVEKQFFDPNTGIVAQIERQTGGTTG
ncbi:MAG: sulfate ABC transporter substrate-binding protein [Gaiellaceae bacterium]